MSRSYYRTIYRPYETWRNGVLIESGPSWPCGSEQLYRSAVVKGQRDGEDGFRLPNAYQMSYILDDRPYGSWAHSRWGAFYEYKLGLGYLMSDLHWGNRFLPEIPYMAENKALIQALNKLKDQKVDLATALAELENTAGLIESVAKRIAKGVEHFKRVAKDAKRGKWNRRALKRAFRAIGRNPRNSWDKDLASQVLAFQYGVRPLLNDVLGSMEALAKVRYHDRIGAPVRVVGKVKSGSKTRRTPYKVGTQGADLLPGYARDKEYTETKVTLWFSCTNSLIRNASDLGMTNLATVLWEKTPFSFIADWFIPVGDWLSSLDAAYGMEFRGGCTTFWRERSIHYTGTSTDSNGRTKLTGRYENRSMVRSAYWTLPTPSMPALKNPASVERAINASALLVALAGDMDEIQRTRFRKARLH